MKQSFKSINEVHNHYENLITDFMVNFIKYIKTDDLINLYNSLEQYQDDMIYYNDEEFFKLHFVNDVNKAVQAISYGEFDINHDYITFDGYGNLKSFSNPYNYIDIDEIINALTDKIIEDESISDDLESYFKEYNCLDELNELISNFNDDVQSLNEELESELV